MVPNWCLYSWKGIRACSSSFPISKLEDRQTDPDPYGCVCFYNHTMFVQMMTPPTISPIWCCFVVAKANIKLFLSYESIVSLIRTVVGRTLKGVQIFRL